MALTRAQLLQGNSTQGAVIPGVQAVTAGIGVQISNTGVLSINGNDPALTSFIKTNNSVAYNAYVWPGSDGPSGYQLTTDGAGNLDWTPSGIPLWTAKGQLNVGTGVGTSALLSVGTSTAFLIANPATASGLAWSNASTSAALLPSGTNIQRPLTGIAGQIRYNSEIGRFEGYKNSTWTGFGGATGGGTDEIFYLNGQIVTTDYTLPANQNAVTAGPITINAGVTVTIPAGQAWSIV